MHRPFCFIPNTSFFVKWGLLWNSTYMMMSLADAVSLSIFCIQYPILSSYIITFSMKFSLLTGVILLASIDSCIAEVSLCIRALYAYYILTIFSKEWIALASTLTGEKMTLLFRSAAFQDAIFILYFQRGHSPLLPIQEPSHSDIWVTTTKNAVYFTK